MARMPLLAASGNNQLMTSERVNWRWSTALLLSIAGGIASSAFAVQRSGRDSSHVEAAKLPLTDRQPATAVSGIRSSHGSRVFIVGQTQLEHPKRVGHVSGVQRFGRDSLYVEFGASAVRHREEATALPAAAPVQQTITPNTRSIASSSSAAVAIPLVNKAPMLDLADLSSPAWVAQLDRARDEITNRQKNQKNTILSAATVTLSLSGFYLIWLLRGGILLSTLLYSLPAWHILDPLPVLARSRRKDAHSNIASDPVEAFFSAAKTPGVPHSQDPRRDQSGSRVLREVHKQSEAGSPPTQARVAGLIR